MCFVSAVMDQYTPYIPQPTAPGLPWNPPATVPLTVPLTQGFIQPIIDPELLRELINSLKGAVKAAEVFDRLTGQPDCIDPEKAQLIERVFELEQKLEELRGVLAS